MAKITCYLCYHAYTVPGTVGTRMGIKIYHRGVSDTLAGWYLLCLHLTHSCPAAIPTQHSLQSTELLILNSEAIAFALESRASYSKLLEARGRANISFQRQLERPKSKF